MTFVDAIATLLAAERDPALRTSPEFIQAQEKVESAPKAKEWFEAERGFYAQHEGLLSATTLRQEARERIRSEIAAGSASPLASMNLSTGFAAEEQQAAAAQGSVKSLSSESRPAITFSRRSMMWLAAAAALALGAFLILPKLVSQNGRNIQAASFAEFGSLFLDGPVNINKRVTVGDSAKLLEEEGAPVCRHYLAKCLKTKTKGCRVLEWNGRHVSLICMEPEPGNIVHVMVMNAEELSKEELGSQCGSILKVNERETKCWTYHDKTYLALAHERNDALDIPPNLFADSR